MFGFINEVPLSDQITTNQLRALAAAILVVLLSGVGFAIAEQSGDDSSNQGPLANGPTTSSLPTVPTTIPGVSTPGTSTPGLPPGSGGPAIPSSTTTTVVPEVLADTGLNESFNKWTGLGFLVSALGISRLIVRSKAA